MAQDARGNSWKELIAADMNHDGRVNAADALEILKTSVGVNTIQPSWVFVPNDPGINPNLASMTKTTVTYKDDFNFASITAPTSATFTGILIDMLLPSVTAPGRGYSSMPAHARTFDRDKALEAILYVAGHLKTASLHSVSKILYLVDKRHLRYLGRLICGDHYVAMEYGPVPSAIYNMMKVADNRETIDPDVDAIIKESLRVQSGRYLKPKRKANTEVLAASEIECLNQTIKKYGQKTFGQLTDVTHDAAWKSVDQNQSISVELIARTLPNSSDLVAYLRTR